MAALLEVSRSAYYQWAKNGVSNRREETGAELVRLIREIVTKHCRPGDGGQAEHEPEGQLLGQRVR
jgi:hypothetical protein